MPNDTCAICAGPASKVMFGRPYCSLHSHYSRRPTDPPAEPCAVCAGPSNRREYGRPYCGFHNSYDHPPKAA